MHDGRIKAGFDAFMQEHRVEHLARRGVQAERDVRQPQRRLNVWPTPLQLTDTLDRLQPVSSRLVLTGAEREGEAVDQDVGGGNLVAIPQSVDQPFGDRYLLLGGTGLALFVDRQGDHRCTMLASQRRHP